MVMRNCRTTTLLCGTATLLTATLLALAQAKPAAEEQERKVKENEVPKLALDALKKIAGTATIVGFEEETEHGQKVYEASWTGAGGKMEALVTASGDLMEIEELVSADKVPAAVRTAAEKDAGKDAPVAFEKKTTVLYEAKFKKGDKSHELLLTPTGDRYEHEDGDDGDEKDDD